MKKAVVLCSAWALMGGTIFAAPAQATVEPADHYKSLISTSIYSANNLYLQTGWYDMDGDDTGADPDMNNANFVGSYYFGEIGDTWRPFLLGGFGFSKIKQNPFEDGHDLELDSSYIKLGGGVNYNPTQNIGLILGVSGLWMKSDGTYGGSDTEMKKYFDADSDTALYDLFAGINLHTELNGYKPYADLTAHYLSIDYDFDLSDSSGWSTDLSAGVYTPVFSHWMNLPVRAHLFVAGSFLSGELRDDVWFGHHYSAGASLLSKVGPLLNIDAFKDTELSFNLQGTRGDNGLSGWKASVSFSIAKF